MFQQVHKTSHKFPDDSSVACGGDTIVVNSDGIGPCLSENVQLLSECQSHKLLKKTEYYRWRFIVFVYSE